MKTGKRLLALALLAVLLLSLAPISAAGVTLTAVNDSLLPLKASTMPTRRSGDIYVPYGVFTGTLGIRAFYDADQQTLVMQDASTTLTFSLSQSYVYDQNMTSYSTPAYTIGGSTFVPVKLMCSQFGLSYSVIAATGAEVLRITDDNAVLSDHVFISSAASKIRDAVDAYQGKPAGGGSPRPDGGGKPKPRPTAPTVPPAELPEAPAPIIRPSRVLLTFTGVPNEHTPDILAALRNAGRPSTFFLPLGADWPGDGLRTIALDGHAFGFSLTPAQADELPALTAANECLALETGLTTHVLMIEGGSQLLTSDQRDALISAGYRLWDPTMSAAEDSRPARQTTRLVLASLSATTAPTVLGLAHTPNTAAVLAPILQDLAVNHVAGGTITLVDTPINLARERR